METAFKEIQAMLEERAEIIGAIMSMNYDEGFLVRRPFRWFFNNDLLNNCYDGFSVESVCEERGLVIVKKINNDIYIAKKAQPGEGE